MRRVYLIYAFRWVAQAKVRLIVLLGILLAIASSVSMPNIISNALHSSDLVGYSIVAVSHTTFYIQLGVLFAGLILIWSVFDAFRLRSEANLFA